MTIATLTLNPALDLATEVDAVEADVKLRCDAPRVDPGGGGLNAARTIAALGGRAVAVHCSGGLIGRRIQRLLDHEGIAQRIVPIEGETRESLAVADRGDGRLYRFLLPGPKLAGQEWRAAFATVCEAAGADGLVLASGSLPPGVPDDAYGRLAREVTARGGRLLLDTNGRALERALGAGLHAIKPNWRELDQLAGAAGPLDDAARRVFAARLVADGAAEIVIVTLGERGALVTTASEQVELSAPRVAVVSAVGGGDAFAGALLLGLERRWPLLAACRLGVAAAAAAVGTPGTAPPGRATVERLHRELGVTTA